MILDGEDDFVNMLRHVLGVLGLTSEVVRHEDYAPGCLDGFDLVIVGPGPGDPRDDDDPKMAALRHAVSSLLATGQPFLAVCLGHQALCHELGIPLAFKDIVFQGTQSAVSYDGRTERVGFYNTFVGRVGAGDALPDGVSVDVDEPTGDVHHLRGPHYRGIQFHAESILTERGYDLLHELVGDLLLGRSAGRPAGWPAWWSAWWSAWRPDGVEPVSATGTVEYGPRRIRSAVVAGIAAFLVANGVLILMSSSNGSAGLAVIPVVLFGLVAVVMLRRVMRREPYLVLDATSFDDRTTVFSVGRVAWSEVSSIEAERAGFVWVVRVGVHDPSALASRLQGLRGRGLERAAANGHPPLVIGVSILAAKPQEVAEEMQQRWRRAGGKPAAGR